MGITFDDIVAMTADLPMVEIGTSYGTPAVLVKGKMFGRMWPADRYVKEGIDDTEVLVVWGEVEAKAELLASHGPVLFETDHYRSHGAYLVRLADVDVDLLADLLEDAYRLRAPRRALDQLNDSD